MGLGHQGKTLKEMLAEKDRVTRESGYIYGLENLELAEEDPAMLTRFHMRLLAACMSARETAKLISASPAAATMGEFLFEIGTPEGDVVSASQGLAGHVLSVPFMVRSMIDLDYEDDPGIREGDIISNNEPLYGSPHASDCYTFIPVFHEGELIAWTVGMNHISDVGGMLPGNLAGFSVSSFTDGWQYPLVKSGENFKQHKWWELMWKTRTRLGTMNILDDKMRVAGAMALYNRILDIVEEFGVDYFRKALREILERERRLLIERIRTQAIPGTYHFVQFHVVRYKGVTGKLFPSSDRDWLLHMPAELRILPEGKLVLDKEGLTSEADFHINCREAGVRAMASLGARTTFAYTSTMNTAMMYVLDHIMPPGSMANPQNPFAGTISGLGIMGRYSVPLWNCLSHAFFCTGFLEESLPHNPVIVAWGMGGVMADGFRWAGGNLSTVGAQSSAGRPFKDGEPVCVGSANLMTDLGEIENWEFVEPTQLYIGQKLVPNYCGHGKFRAGLGLGICQMVCDPGQHLTLAVFGSASSEVTGAYSGMCGGYPALGPVTYFLHDTNMREILEKGLPYPTDFVQVREWLKEGKLKAGSVELYHADTPNVVLKDGDLFVTAALANCGWGDPLEREYDLVQDDVRYGWLASDVVRGVYGVVTDKEGKVKAKESEELRQQMRNRRKERSVDAKDWWKEEREQVLNKGFSEDVYNMYADVLKYDKFRRQFMGMWQLPEDYRL